jgi:glucoamylase
MTEAPGAPGILPRWTSSAKSGVGTALDPLSRVWFTISHGILNEIYYPRVDQACTRDLGFLITDGNSFFSEEKRDAHHVVMPIEDGVPAFHLRNTCIHGRYVLEKRIISDPGSDVVLQSIRLLNSGETPLRLFALLSPHLANRGQHNTAWIGEYKGVPMLFAERDGTALALGASVPWLARSAGFVGVSDGWRDIHQNLRLATCYDSATDGNVALTGELDLNAAGPEPITLALGFARTWSEAAYRVRASLLAGFETAHARYTANWRAWQATLHPLDRPASTQPNNHNSYRISTAVLRCHEAPTFPGGIIAGLSIPWGASKGDNDLGGYHLVWPRDLVQTAGALIACGAKTQARHVLDYLRTIQEPNGGWFQNTWLDGTPYWTGLQLDECAFPILLLDMALRHDVIKPAEAAAYHDMLHRAAGFILRNGPITGQDRWEEDGGLSSSTLPVAIAALLAAADLVHSDTEAALLRDTADAWNDAIETWLYATDTPLAAAAGVPGTYVRIAPPEGPDGTVTIKNVPNENSEIRAADLISPDALALVRFGLRDAHDPRIKNTLAAIDHALKIDLPQGPCWHRYNGDGYGEHADGSPFDGTGIGRAWPLLTGERAHYEIAAGNIQAAEHLRDTLERLTSRGGLMPEQVWDTDDIPARELFRGHPSGSAMPLVWAHGEHIKLCRSLADGAVFDLPPQPANRYIKTTNLPRCAIWRPDLPITTIHAGRTLRIDLPQSATIHWSSDHWAHTSDTPTIDTPFGLFHAEISTSNLTPGQTILFTWRFGQSWINQNYELAIV